MSSRSLRRRSYEAQDELSGRNKRRARDALLTTGGDPPKRPRGDEPWKYNREQRWRDGGKGKDKHSGGQWQKGKGKGKGKDKGQGKGKGKSKGGKDNAGKGWKQTDVICYHFRDKGECPWGEACRFQHVKKGGGEGDAAKREY